MKKNFLGVAFVLFAILTCVTSFKEANKTSIQLTPAQLSNVEALSDNREVTDPNESWSSEMKTCYKVDSLPGYGSNVSIDGQRCEYVPDPYKSCNRSRQFGCGRK